MRRPRRWASPNKAYATGWSHSKRSSASSCTARFGVRGERPSSRLRGSGSCRTRLAFLDRAHELCRACDLETGRQEVRVVASQYLTRYVLIDVLRTFRSIAPAIHVRVSTMNEADVVDALLENSEVAFGWPRRTSRRQAFTIPSCSR